MPIFPSDLEIMSFNLLSAYFLTLTNQLLTKVVLT